MDSTTGLRCDSGLGVGENLIVATATDANGSTSAAERVRISRGPVGLFHGYLTNPGDWDAAAERLEASGFEVSRIDLRVQQNLKGEIRIPFSFHSTASTEPKTKGRRFFAKAAKVEPPIRFKLWETKLDFAKKVLGVLQEFFKPIFPDKDKTLFDGDLLGNSAKLCMEGTCFGAALNGKFTFLVKDLALGVRLDVLPTLSLDKGSWVTPKEGKFTVPIEISGHRLALVGLRLKTTYFSGKTGDFIVSPVVELDSPLFGLKLANGDLFKSGPEVSAFVDSTLARTGFERMSLVGHDMGGLLARWYVNHTPVPRRIEKAVFIGTPHRGSETLFIGYKGAKYAIGALSKMTGALGPLVKSLAGALLDMVLGDAGKQLFPHSNYLQALNGHPERPNWDLPDPSDFLTDQVQVYNYLGQDYIGGVEWLSPSFTHFHVPLGFKNPIYSLPNVDDFLIPWVARGDFFVSIDSAGLANDSVTERIIDGWQAFHWLLNGEHGDNFELLLSDLLAPHIIPGAAAPTAAFPAVAAAKFSAAAPFAALVPTSATSLDGLAASHTLSRDAVLAPGEALDLEIRADGTLSDGLVLAQATGPIAIEVDGPRGRVHPAPPEPGSNARWVALGTPDLGTYFARVTLSPEATEPAAVLISATFKTPAFLALRTAGAAQTQSGADRVPGEDVLLNALFASAAGPLDGGSVACTVRAPDGVTRAVELYDDGAHVDGDPGDGVHTGVLTGGATQLPGTYEASCRAIGTMAGEVIERYAELDFRVRWPVAIGILPGSLQVVGQPRQGVPTTISAVVFNDSSQDAAVVAVQAAERVGGVDRVIGCAVPGRIPAGKSAKIEIPWTPADGGCRTLTLALAGPAAGTQISDDPAVPPEAFARATTTACPLAAPRALVADPGGPYRYQAGGRRVTFDGTGSENTTAQTRFEWTVSSGGAIVASGVGRIVVLDLPKAPDVTAKLRLVDPVLGTVEATTPVTFVGALDHDDWLLDTVPPVAVIDAPDVAYVGEPVTIRSLAYDDMGVPPVQVFRLGGVGAGDADAIGRVIRPVFNGPGEYDIELSVVDNAGFRSSATRTLRVERRAPAIANVLLPPSMEVGREAAAYVQLSGAGAGEEVQVTLGSSTPDGFEIRAAGSAQTDACGIAQVRITPRSLDVADLRVEVLGYTSCDPLTGACSSGVVAENPSGVPRQPVDTSGPHIEVSSPAADVALSACHPATPQFSVTDDGVGVDLATVAVTLDGLPLANGSACIGGTCSVAIDTASLPPGVHHLAIKAEDALGNASAVSRDYRVEPDLESLVCRLGAGVCAGIAPDGTENALLAQISAAAARRDARNLEAAANVLGAFMSFVDAQRGQHLPSACADVLEADADWILRVRWGMYLAQVR